MTGTDLVIVGGGPAGLATAIGARLAGLSVRLLERSQPPLDKACGEGLMPDAVGRLSDLGVNLSPEDSHGLRGIRYYDGELVAEGLFPRSAGLGVRRLALHRALTARAEELGVELWWGEAALALALSSASRRRPPVRGVLTSRGVAEGRWVVGADGLRSRVRAWAGLDRPSGAVAVRHSESRGAPDSRAGQRFGMRQHFAVRPWSDMVEVHWGPGCEAYVTPISPTEVGVAVLWSAGPAKVSFHDFLACFPRLAARLQGATTTSRVRGCGPFRQQPTSVARGNVLLVGDASGYLDAITGEGIAVALHQSAALVSSLVEPGGGHPAAYRAAHRRIVRLPNFLTGLVLALEQRPSLRRRALRALAAEPALFSRLLGIHSRALPPAGLGFEGALRLVYRLVTA